MPGKRAAQSTTLTISINTELSKKLKNEAARRDLSVSRLCQHLLTKSLSSDHGLEERLRDPNVIQMLAAMSRPSLAKRIPKMVEEMIASDDQQESIIWQGIQREVEESDGGKPQLIPSRIVHPHTHHRVKAIK